MAISPQLRLQIIGPPLIAGLSTGLWTGVQHPIFIILGCQDSYVL